MAAIIKLRKAPVTGPAAAGVGSGTTFTKNAATGFFEATIGAEKALALPADGNGNAKANLGMRRDTLANLLTLAGLPGEISLPTDYRGIVCHTGEVGGAYYVGNDAYMVDVTNNPQIAAEGLFTIPRGFRTVVLGPKGATPHATVVSNGGIGIGVQLTVGQSIYDGLNTSAFRIYITADLTSSPYVYFDSSGLTDLTGGINYLEFSSQFSVGVDTANATLITAKSVVYN